MWFTLSAHSFQSHFIAALIYCPVKHVDSIYPFTSINANPYLLLYWIYPIYPFTFKIASYYLCICLLSLPYLPFYSQHLSNNHCRAWSSLSSLIPSLILHTSQVAKRQLWQIRVLCPFLGHKTLFYAQFLDIGHESVMLSSEVQGTSRKCKNCKTMSSRGALFSTKPYHRRVVSFHLTWWTVEGLS